MVIWAFLLRSRRATGYAIASETLHATPLLRTLRMPNAKEVFLWGFWVFPPTRPRENEVKTLLFILYACFMSFCEDVGVFFARAGALPPPSHLFVNYSKRILHQKC